MRCFMKWVGWNDHVCRGTKEDKKYMDFRGELFYGPWLILLLACSSWRGIGSCLASDSLLKSMSILTLGADAALIGVSKEATGGLTI